MAITNFKMGSNQTYIGETFNNPYTMAAGSNNTFIDCTFNQSYPSHSWSCFVLTAKGTVSTVGNKFINCTFSGGLEEQAGGDCGTKGALWTVNSVSGNSVSLTLLRDAWNNRNNYGVGAHLVVQRGDGIGNYYLITERTGDTFTLSSDKFDVSDIVVGNHVTTTIAVVDNEWTNCTALTSKANVQRNVTWRGVKWIWGGDGVMGGFGGSGTTTIVSGFSNYGNVFGSIYTRCKVIGDGWTLVGGETENGVEVTQTGFWDRGVVLNNAASAEPLPETDPHPSVPHHSTYRYCTVTGCDQAFIGGPFQLGLHYGDFYFPPTGIMDVLGTHQVAEYPSSHILVYGCNFGGGQFDNWFGNVVKSRWVNTSQEPISTFDVCLQRFGTLWKSDYPFSDQYNSTAYDPFPTKSVNLGDQSLADYTIEYIDEPQQPFYAGDQVVTNLYLGTQEVINLKAGE